MLSIILQGVFSLTKLSGKDSEDHFWKSFNSALSDFTPTNDDNDEGKYIMYNAKTEKNPHVINVQFYEKKNEGTYMKFFRAKKDDVIKRVKQYDSDEIEIQSKAFHEFIKKMIELKPGEKGRLHFHMIEDVKEKVLKLESTGKLKFIENFDKQSQTVILDLFFQENKLGIFTINSVEENNEFYLIVSLITTSLQVQKKYEIKIPVFDVNTAYFDSKMNSLTSILNLNGHVNCNEDNFSQFEHFALNGGIPLVQIVFNKKLINQNLKTFTLVSSGGDQATGEIRYIAPEGIDVGSYEIVVKMDGVEKIKTPFKRMTIEEYHKFLESLRIRDLFLSFYDKIVILFKAQFIEVNSESKNDITFVPSTKTYQLFYKHKILTAKIGKTDIVELEYFETTTQSTLGLITYLPSLSKITSEVEKREFAPDLIAEYFNGIFTLIQNSKKNGLDKSKMTSSISRKNSIKTKL